MRAEEAADTVEIPMPAIPAAARAIPARHITTALTIVPDRLRPAPAAGQAHRRLRILVPLVRRHPVRRQAPVRLPRTRPRALLQTLAAARLPDQVTAHRPDQVTAHRPDQVTARRHNPPRPRIQAAGRHSKRSTQLRAGLLACSNLPPTKVL